MNDTQLPEIFEQMLTELNAISGIVEKLQNIDVEDINTSDKVKLFNILSKSLTTSKYVIELYRNTVNENPEGLGFKFDARGPITIVRDATQFLSEFDWDNPEFSNSMKELLTHSESLYAMVHSFK